jgi:ABC-type spermidine/putrescine transport system permease subunit II
MAWCSCPRHEAGSICGGRNIGTLPLRPWALMRTGFTPDLDALVTLILAGSIGLCVAVARLIRV